MTARQLEKEPTGVVGLDRMLNGGLIRNRPALVLGGPGAGKSALGYQFLITGAEKGEPSLLIALDEPESEIRENMTYFGWDPGKIQYSAIEPGVNDDLLSDPFKLTSAIYNTIHQRQIKRVVIDSLTTLKAMYFDHEVREAIFDLMKKLSEVGTTAILLSDAGERSVMEGYLARAVILLRSFPKQSSGLRRSVQVVKMRGSRFDEKARPVRLGPLGLQVFDSEQVL